MNGYAVLRILAPRLAAAALLVLLPSLGARAQQRDGSAFQVNTYTTGAQGSAQVARQPDGAFMVVWESNAQDGSLSSTFGRMFASDGSPLGDDFLINTYTTGRPVHPSVAATADGEFVVVWASWGDQSALYRQRFGPTGARVGTEFRVDTDGADALHPRVAASPRGSFVVVWQSWYPDGRGPGQIFGRCFTAAGLPSGAVFQVNSNTTQRQYRASVAMSDDDAFVVVWTNGDTQQTIGRLYASDCTRIGDEFYAHSGVFPVVAMTAGGDFVVAASHEEGPQPASARRFASDGTPLGPEFNVSDSFFTDTVSGVVMDASGNFLVTWDWHENEYDPTKYTIKARAFRADGIALTAPFFVSTDYGWKGGSSVASDDAGNFVVTWGNVEGGNFDIIGQRFLTPEIIFRDGFDASPSTSSAPNVALRR